MPRVVVHGGGVGCHAMGYGTMRIGMYYDKGHYEKGWGAMRRGGVL